ncbi:hypothetical protein BDV93DRAFT_514438 [Ceratobasidium sp. AG-I]|nr:hypothetical protein BDV93DRAFT_514438 [Ceratobasidium sp. AG-I]
MDPERSQRELQKTANRTARPRKPHASGGDGFDGGRIQTSAAGGIRIGRVSWRRSLIRMMGSMGGGYPKRGGEYVVHGFVVSDREHEDAAGGSPGDKRRQRAEETDAGADSLDEADEKIERDAAKRHKRGWRQGRMQTTGTRRATGRVSGEE